MVHATRLRDIKPPSGHGCSNRTLTGLAPAAAARAPFACPSGERLKFALADYVM
jgi:hypothetical protein